MTSFDALNKARWWERAASLALAATLLTAAFAFTTAWPALPIAVAVWCVHRASVWRAWDRGHFAGRWSVLEEQRGQKAAAMADAEAWKEAGWEPLGYVCDAGFERAGDRPEPPAAPAAAEQPISLAALAEQLADATAASLIARGTTPGDLAEPVTVTIDCTGRNGDEGALRRQGAVDATGSPDVPLGAAADRDDPGADQHR